MIIESSAVVAILQEESGVEELVLKMAEAPRRSISAVSYLEAAMVLIPLRGDEAGRELDRFLAEAAVEILPVDAVQAKIARNGFLRFGKGRHPARLNFGDCFSYALAMQLSEPLLFVGNDFSQTDVLIA